ncbi:hypothetical protein TNCV_4590801 [Trichonephila clavipes]|nr:hypothetical protein TNCV_4590801 [Trichonephila clavipes]
MTLTLQERTVLVKWFYRKGYPATEALLKSWSLKGLRNGPLSSLGLINMIKKLEARVLMQPFELKLHESGSLTSTGKQRKFHHAISLTVHKERCQQSEKRSTH